MWRSRLLFSCCFSTSRSSGGIRASSTVCSSSSSRSSSSSSSSQLRFASVMSRALLLPRTVTREFLRFGDSFSASPQIGSEIAHAAAQTLAQQRAQGGAVDIADLGRDRLDIEPAAMEQRLRALDAQILEIRERRFAEHRLAAALQRARAGRERAGGILQRKPVLQMLARPALEACD